MVEQSVLRRPGGRTALNRVRILRATAEILLGAGYERLSIAQVAAAAGVAESTIYRRWPDRASLAADALAELVRAENPVPDTGSFEKDLRALLTRIVGLLRRPEIARIVRVVVALEGDESTAARDDFWASRFTDSAAIVVRAVERGEVPADTDPHEVVEDLAGVVWFRLLVTGRPLDDDVIERSVQLVLHRHATTTPHAQ